MVARFQHPKTRAISARNRHRDRNFSEHGIYHGIELSHHAKTHARQGSRLTINNRVGVNIPTESALIPLVSLRIV